ncbi:unnamed protein product [Chrysoparadoxa australica]
MDKPAGQTQPCWELRGSGGDRGFLRLSASMLWGLMIGRARLCSSQWTTTPPFLPLLSALSPLIPLREGTTPAEVLKTFANLFQGLKELSVASVAMLLIGPNLPSPLAAACEHPEVAFMGLDVKLAFCAGLYDEVGRLGVDMLYYFGTPWLRSLCWQCWGVCSVCCIGCPWAFRLSWILEGSGTIPSWSGLTVSFGLSRRLLVSHQRTLPENSLCCFSLQLQVKPPIPHLMLLYNAGLWGYDSWLPTLTFMATRKGSRPEPRKSYMLLTSCGPSSLTTEELTASNATIPWKKPKTTATR